MRARVFNPAGSECSCPKQWQSGLRPRARLATMPAAKRSRSVSAAAAPHQAVEAGMRATASASSASAGTATRTGVSDGRFSTMPMAPSSVCSSTRTTVRRK